ncbi:M57 family metalloprotease [Ascidiimonas sp. W6]|uniref:M57 family metalloprotease n=1 Tax=Ascidiimonas meishanensis TaxID=3128903 RepID=UPI0030ECA835
MQEMIDNSLDNIEDLGYSFLVENDVLISKNDFHNYINQGNRLNKKPSAERHFFTSVINTPTTGYRVIKVYFQGGSDLPASESFNVLDTVYSTWYKELGFAMLQFWNRFPDLKIKFERVNLTISDLMAWRSIPAGTDIVIKGDNGTLPNTTVAAAGFPSNGNPYDEIIINGDFLNGLKLTAGQKRWNLMHELGQCIGFRHTNLRLRRESTVNPPANPVFATLNAEDLYSVFN